MSRLKISFSSSRINLAMWPHMYPELLNLEAHYRGVVGATCASSSCLRTTWATLEPRLGNLYCLRAGQEHSWAFSIARSQG